MGDIIDIRLQKIKLGCVDWIHLVQNGRF